MTVAAIGTPQGGCLTFVNETFTGNLTSVISAQLAIASTDRLWVRAWSLTVTGNSAVCPIQLKGSSTGTYAADRIPAIAAAGVGAQVRGLFQSPPGFPGFVLAAGEELVIGGGGTSGVLDGVVYYTVNIA